MARVEDAPEPADGGHLRMTVIDWARSILRALLQQFARDLAQLLAIVLFGVTLAEPSPVDVAEIVFARIRTELGAGGKMLNLIRTDSELFA